MSSEYKKQLSEQNMIDLENLFNVKSNRNGTVYSFIVLNSRLKNSVALDIFMDDKLISVYSENTHLQLQNCAEFIISAMLEEVIFYSENNDKISGLIISKSGDCSLYANVDKNTLKSDFTDLNSEKLLSAVALSVIDAN
ncbi:MAG: hypothetical protein MUE56_09010 [Ignavibacteria bacterium]|nr:hypothetical protein [Ignavibacteria bacterium]